MDVLAFESILAAFTALWTCFVHVEDALEGQSI